MSTASATESDIDAFLSQTTGRAHPEGQSIKSGELKEIKNPLQPVQAISTPEQGTVGSSGG